MTTKSQAVFYKTLTRLTEDAKNRVEECLNCFLRAAGRADRRAEATKALDATNRILDILHNDDRPKWLQPLQESLKVAIEQENNDMGIDAVKKIASQYLPELKRHSWQLNETRPNAEWDFDLLFQRYRDEYRLPELFDTIVGYLREIIEFGEIDSAKLSQDLRELIALIEKTKQGSYSAVKSTAWFFTTWLKHGGADFAKKIPVLGSAIKGLEETCKELNIDLKEINRKISDQFKAATSKAFPKLPEEEIEKLNFEPLDPPEPKLLTHDPNVPSIEKVPEETESLVTSKEPSGG